MLSLTPGNHWRGEHLAEENEEHPLEETHWLPQMPRERGMACQRGMLASPSCFAIFAAKRPLTPAHIGGNTACLGVR